MPKKFYDYLAENNDHVLELIDHPELFRKLLSDKPKAAENLIIFYNDNKDKPWAKEGLQKIRNEIRLKTFQLPPKDKRGIPLISAGINLNRANNFVLKYFPKVPKGTIWDIINAFK